VPVRSRVPHAQSMGVPSAQAGPSRVREGGTPPTGLPKPPVPSPSASAPHSGAGASAEGDGAGGRPPRQLQILRLRLRLRSGGSAGRESPVAFRGPLGRWGRSPTDGSGGVPPAWGPGTQGPRPGALWRRYAVLFGKPAQWDASSLSSFPIRRPSLIWVGGRGTPVQPQRRGPEGARREPPSVAVRGADPSAPDRAGGCPSPGFSGTDSRPDVAGPTGAHARLPRRVSSQRERHREGGVSPGELATGDHPQPVSSRPSCPDLDHERSARHEYPDHLGEANCSGDNPRIPRKHFVGSTGTR